MLSIQIATSMLSLPSKDQIQLETHPHDQFVTAVTLFHLNFPLIQKDAPRLKFLFCPFS